MQTPSNGGFTSNNDGENGKFRISISNQHFDFKQFEIADQKVTGAQIGQEVGANPITDYVVLQLLKSGELESLRPTETTDLVEKGVERFFVIKGSLTYRFVVDGRSMEWPLAKIPGKHVKMLVGAKLDDVLVIDLPEGDRVIGNEEDVNLKADGVEQLRIRKAPRLVTVIYNQDQKFELEPGVYTTEKLMEIFKVPPGHKLDLFSDHGIQELTPSEKIEIKEGMEFCSHPPRGQSS